MKTFLIVVIGVVVGLMAFNIGSDLYTEYKHEKIVEQCKSEADAPEWADGIANFACEHWAD